MKLRLLPSEVTGSGLQFLSSYILNDTVAIDAGSIGFVGTPKQQVKVDHIFLTHSHLDHVGGLPIFLDTVVEMGGEVVSLHATNWVLDVLRSDIFNDRIMPDFLRISRNGPVFLNLFPMEPGTMAVASGLKITSFEVNHVVPTVAYIIDDGKDAIAIATDTAPCENLYSKLAGIPHLRALLLDCSFPVTQKELARISGHMTTADFATVAKKLSPQIEVWAIHIKPRYHDEVLADLERLLGSSARILESGRDYVWDAGKQ